MCCSLLWCSRCTFVLVGSGNLCHFLTLYLLFDADTVKHLNGLLNAKKEGYEAAVCFVVQMEGVKYLEPNDDTHPEFGQALRRAAAGGVEVLAFACRVKPDAVVPAETVPVILGED